MASGKGKAPNERPEAPGLESLVDLSGIADKFGVGVRTVERWRSAGILPRPDLQIGRIKRWKISTLAKWLEERG